ncbi:MAG: hypothetical protein DME70_09330 [Verrucomicrobia bacterium]|nr:MAG: hypothetical protein DME70_09330 [Verrucomicrobiota bacterium]
MEFPLTTVTPGVVVVRVAEIAVSFAHPLFLRPRFKSTHSARLTMPLLLPPESLIVNPFASSFEVPVMAKFWVTVPPPVGATGAEAGVAEAQLRFGSAAVAV